MLPEVEKLLTLQERDQRIRTLRHELDAIPAETRFKEKQIADSAARLETSKTRMKAIEVERKALELDVQARRETINRYKTQQLQTRKNEEYAALGHEIGAAETAIAAIEDRELELMEEAESLRPVIAEAERAHTAERSQLQAQIAELAAKTTTIQARIIELETSHPDLAASLDPDLLDQYQRLFKSKAGAALAELEHEVCTGCHMKVTTQTSLAVRADKLLIHCPNCGRVLYLSR